MMNMIWKSIFWYWCRIKNFWRKIWMGFPTVPSWIYEIKQGKGDLDWEGNETL